MMQTELLKGHQTWIETEVGSVLTLADILPERPGLRMLIVGKTPAPVSVKVGHYFRGDKVSASGVCYGNMKS